MEYTNEIETPSRKDTKLMVTIETKSLLAKKMRLRVWGYTNGEYAKPLLLSAATGIGGYIKKNWKKSFGW